MKNFKSHIKITLLLLFTASFNSYASDPITINQANDIATYTPGVPVTIDVLANDDVTSDNLVSVRLLGLNESITGSALTTLMVVGEGLWTVNDNTDTVTFSPDSGFTGVPTPIRYYLVIDIEDAFISIVFSQITLRLASQPIPSLGTLGLLLSTLILGFLGRRKIKASL